MFLASPLGGDDEKIGDFQQRKYVHMVPLLLFFDTYVQMVAFFLASPLGGDVEKISDFQKEKIRSHGSLFLANTFTW